MEDDLRLLVKHAQLSAGAQSFKGFSVGYSSVKGAFTAPPLWCRNRRAAKEALTLLNCSHVVNPCGVAVAEARRALRVIGTPILMELCVCWLNSGHIPAAAEAPTLVETIAIALPGARPEVEK